MIENSNNSWEISRAFYALNRYFDNSYTFKMLTYFKVPQDGEVRLDISVVGAFGNEEFDELRQEITYNLLNPKK